MKTNNEERKTWEYNQGNVNLNITLKVDTPKDMQDFIKILTKSQADIQKEIDKRFNKNGK